MSSSADSLPPPFPLDWSSFQERPVAAPVELLSPAAELAAALQRCRRELTAERAAAADAAAKARADAAEQAVLVHQLAAALDRHDQALADAGLERARKTLRIVHKQMLTALEDSGLSVVDPLGRPFREIADSVEVLAWRHGDEFDGEVVAETLKPIIRHGAEVIRQGEVIMGAPAPDSDEEDV
ncbi:nucleotide exchange factor GrpE [Kutzneria sp. CA-103260]|uniref:nucleotide exchange factor GrpE n=1 Tax=Kutzneria sp. CA-103260 TaxID=2802641 RepID=UPI001BAC63D5|nr:nucleotide exchange factor GrpE [Kutzneria sp. CA-103260]QUQ67112.1 GrpE [Kutzneria sp. CA-103260]